MVRISTAAVLAGIALLVLPVPPIASAALGIVVIVVGVALRVFTDN